MNIGALSGSWGLWETSNAEQIQRQTQASGGYNARTYSGDTVSFSEEAIKLAAAWLEARSEAMKASEKAGDSADEQHEDLVQRFRSVVNRPEYGNTDSAAQADESEHHASGAGGGASNDESSDESSETLDEKISEIEKKLAQLAAQLLSLMQGDAPDGAKEAKAQTLEEQMSSLSAQLADLKAQKQAMAASA